MQTEEQAAARYSVPLLESLEDCDEMMSRPAPGVVETLKSLDGDILVLGVGGKMGPSLARMARRALDEAGLRRKVIGVARFSDSAVRQRIEAAGVETVQADLLDRGQLKGLPDAPNVVFMAGRKFGSTGAESLTWAMNTFLPGLVAERYRQSRIVAFSTGNVYPLVPVKHGTADETLPLGPVGEYAQSCLGRERILEHFSRTNSIPMAFIRLSYANELRYGVVVDVAKKVAAGEPVDVTMGHATIIWQGDANAQTLMAFSRCACPPEALNVTGPETVSIRALAHRIGQLLGKAVTIQGDEADTALLLNSGRACSAFGYPQVPLDTMVQWICHWVEMGGETNGKPTHFEQRDGRF